MAVRSPEKKKKKAKDKQPWYLGWGPIVILCVLVWPVGLIMLFLKLTDMRRAKEERVPDSVFRSYSADKTEEENRQAVKREKSTLNAIKMTKIIVPLIILVSGADLTLNIANLILNGWQKALWLETLENIAWLAAACGLAYLCYTMSQRQKRFYQYLGIIGTNRSFPVKSICTLTGYEPDQVTEDLEEMKKRFFFGSGAHLNRDSMVFYRQAAE